MYVCKCIHVCIYPQTKNLTFQGFHSVRCLMRMHTKSLFWRAAECYGSQTPAAVPS